MIDALIKRVSVTYNVIKCTHIGEKRCNCSCFEIDQEMDAILLIIGIAYRVCRIVIKSVQQCQGFQSGPVPGTFTRLRSCIVPAEITEPPQN